MMNLTNIINKFKKKRNRKKAIKKLKFFKEVRFKKIIYGILYVFLVISLLYNVLFLINTTIANKDYFSIFGISIIPQEDLIITREAKKSNEIHVNDIIAYSINNRIRINKVTNILRDRDNGKLYYSTYTEGNYYPDIEKVYENQVIGKRISSIPMLGGFVKFLQSKVISVIAIIILGLRFSYNRYSYEMQKRRNRKKKKDVYDSYKQ